MTKEAPLWRPWAIITSPVLAVKGAICLTCFKAAPKLNRCGGCKRVWYCSQGCQKKDWKKTHKKLCPKLATINGVNSTESCDPQTWKKYREDTLKSVQVWQTIIPFGETEQRLVRYQPYCRKCYRTIFQLPESLNLSICPNCSLSHHCTACPSFHDPDQCAQLRDIGQAERFQIQHFLETEEYAPRMLTQAPRTTYVPLSTAKSWYDYYTRISDKNMITGLILPDLKPLQDNIEMACALSASTVETTMMLTIIAALEAVLGDRLGTKETLNVHFVGATSRELNSLMCFEEILHLLPALNQLHCSFVGIDMANPISGTDILTLDCCPTCTIARSQHFNVVNNYWPGLDSKRTRSMNMWKEPYHDYIKTEHYKKPDLAVAFQTGHTFEEQDSWRPTIQLLLNTDHPTVFTTYNKAELLSEVEHLKKLGAKFIVEGEKNKWRGMQPTLDPLEEEENIAYYINQYWYVITGHGSKD